MGETVTGWRKPRRSMANGNCAEVGVTRAGVAVRDTKDRAGTRLEVPRDEWAAFTDRVRSGAFS